MQRFQIGEPDHAIEFREGGGKSLRGAQIMTRREGVTCVEADADARLVFDERNYVR